MKSFQIGLVYLLTFMISSSVHSYGLGSMINGTSIISAEEDSLQDSGNTNDLGAPYLALQSDSLSDGYMKETFQVIVEGGYSFPLFNRGENFSRYHAIIGSRLSQTFSLGVGVGQRFFNYSSGSITPFFLDLRTDFLPSKNSGYFAFQLGKSFGESSVIQPGMLIGIGFGYSHVYTPKNRLYVGLNIDVQFGKIEETSGGPFSLTTTETVQYLIAPGLTAGFSF